MRMQSTLGVTLLVLVVVSSAGAQNAPYSGPSPAFAPAGVGRGMSAPQGTYAPQGYGVRPQPGYQDQYSGSQAGAGQWPYYPYPPYHNPYYNQRMNARQALSGTIDWFFALPSNLMDRVSGFLDGRIFPQMPASQGARQAPQRPVPNQPNQATAPVLPRAKEMGQTPR